MKLHITNIRWDIDETEDYEADCAELGLPGSDYLEIDDGEDPEEVISDYLSDRWGYCVANDPDYEIIGG